jgi:hypothetical protein
MLQQAIDQYLMNHDTNTTASLFLPSMIQLTRAMTMIETSPVQNYWFWEQSDRIYATCNMQHC